SQCHGRPSVTGRAADPVHHVRLPGRTYGHRADPLDRPGRAVAMRVPPFDRFRRMSASLGLFVLGMVVGAAVYNGLLVAKFEALANQLYETEEKLGQYELEIRSLTLYKNQHAIIKKIVTHIETNRGPDGSPQPLDAVT